MEDSPTEHIVDVFCRRAGVDVEDKRCRYVVTKEESAWAQERYPRTSKPRVGIQAEATSSCRSYPPAMMRVVASILAAKGFEVFLFGAPGSLRVDGKSPFVNLTVPGHNIRESAAILSHCDACVAPDSAIAHLAGALDIPTVALFGPFHWRERTAYAPSIQAIQGVAPCSPCHHHARSDVWPMGMPCATAKQCVALAQIDPARIVTKVEQLVKR